MTLALVCTTDGRDGVAILYEAIVVVQKRKGSLDWGEGGLERHTQSLEVLEDKSYVLRSRLDIGYGEGQEGREVTPGLLALAPRPMAVPLRCRILDKDQVWGRG